MYRAWISDCGKVTHFHNGHFVAPYGVIVACIDEAIVRVSSIASRGAG